MDLHGENEQEKMCREKQHADQNNIEKKIVQLERMPGEKECVEKKNTRRNKKWMKKKKNAQ